MQNDLIYYNVRGRNDVSAHDCVGRASRLAAVYEVYAERLNTCTTSVYGN